ncbi:MAG: secondary thiamine-phosphate synthase enzyme YjbQ [Planctomycetota bacterium]
MTLWHQSELVLPAKPRGCHLVTDPISKASGPLSRVSIGVLHVFIQHTSAALTINENADPDVRADFETAMNHAVPETLPYIHTLEGSDDMPAHVKSSMMGSSVSVPVGDGRLRLGTWQGIYLCEFRNHGGPRRLVLTLQGQVAS